MFAQTNQKIKQQQQQQQHFVLAFTVFRFLDDDVYFCRVNKTRLTTHIKHLGLVMKYFVVMRHIEKCFLLQTITTFVRSATTTAHFDLADELHAPAIKMSTTSGTPSVESLQQFKVWHV